MDRKIAVRFYQIVPSPKDQHDLITLIKNVADFGEKSSELKIDEHLFWLEHLKCDGAVAEGVLCRRQTENLPPSAPPDEGLKPLGIPAIGQTVAWYYDSELSVICFESARNGVTVGRFIKFLRETNNVKFNISYFPVVDKSVLNRFKNNRVRSLSLRVASPTNLNAVTDQTKTIKSGLSTLFNTRISTQVEVSFRMRAGEDDINKKSVFPIVRFFQQEHNDERGDVTKITAETIDGDGKSDVLNLIEGMMKMSAEIELPDDDPDKNCEVRIDFVKKAFDLNKDALVEQFST